MWKVTAWFRNIDIYSGAFLQLLELEIRSERGDSQGHNGVACQVQRRDRRDICERVEYYCRQCIIAKVATVIGCIS